MKILRPFLFTILLLFFSSLLKAQIDAGFAFTVGGGCANQVFFTDTSSGNIVSWQWDFGDGTTSSQQSPVHTYQWPGAYAVRLAVFDTFNNVDTTSAVVNVNQNSPITVNITTSNNTACDSAGVLIGNGSAEAQASGGAPPFSFSWSNGATTPIITGLSAGTYTVTVFDANGCSSAVTASIIDSLTFSSQLGTVQPTTCGNCDGFASVSPAGGNPPYQYLWSSGDTGQTQSNLCPGLYSLTIEDANSCTSIQDSIFIGGQSSCFDTIRGHVFYDENGNCVQDSSEQNAANVWVDIAPGGAVFTDALGNYTIITDTGSFDLSIGSSNLDILCPSNGVLNVNFTAPGQTSTGNDFAVEMLPVQDLRASLFCGIARPGFDQYFSFTISNDGDWSSGIVIAFELDSNLTFDYTWGNTPAPDSIDTQNNMIYWSIDSLQAFETSTFQFYAQIPTIPQVNLGDILSSSVTVYPLNGDARQSNNVSDCNRLVTGAYDPNDKAVTPKGAGAEGNITQQDTLMHYRIRFQNTGTDTAFTVVIRDTLDSNLDWGSFKMGTASHDYEVKFEEDDILVFTFDNILLPDSNVNEPASHGHVTYYMEHDGRLPLGTEITNRAAIYFDFNPPIITNTVMNKIYEPVGVQEVKSLQASIYPNPTEDQIIIDAKSATIIQIIVTDISGKQLYQKQSINQSQYQLDLNLESGIYLVQVYAEEGVVTKKMVVR